MVMGMVVYNGTAAVQTAAVNNAIIFLYNWFPLILFVLMFLASQAYQIDKIRPQMNAGLEARRKAEAESTAA